MSDHALTTTTLALEATQDRLGWDQPARLFGITPSFTWIQVDEGDPYDIVDLFTLLPGEDFVAVALVVEGWASPPGGPMPRHHPRRERVRTVVAVPRTGEQVAVVRRRGAEPEVMPPGGTGALMEELEQVWTRATAVES
jgi:hypothetical protein